MNCLLQAKRVFVDGRGLESALEAMCVSVEAVRVLIEALRWFRGRERLEEVPENVNKGRQSVESAIRGCKRILKVPKHENFSLAFFALSEPIWVGD